MDVEKLINCVRQNSILYDLSNKDYKNVTLKALIWESIASELKQKCSLLRRPQPQPRPEDDGRAAQKTDDGNERNDPDSSSNPGPGPAKTARLNTDEGGGPNHGGGSQRHQRPSHQRQNEQGSLLRRPQPQPRPEDDGRATQMTDDGNDPDSSSNPGPGPAKTARFNTDEGGGPNHGGSQRHQRPPHQRHNEQGLRLVRQEDRPRGHWPRQRNEHRNNNQNDNNNRGRNDRHHNRRQNLNERCAGFKTLQDMASSGDEEIVVIVNEKKTQFMNLLESTIDPTEKGDMYVLIMEIISKVCQSIFDELKLRLLLDICNSRFIGNLRHYLTELPYATNKRRNSLYWNNQESFWNNYVKFCQCIIEISPSSALHKCRSLIEAISKCCLEGLRDRHGFGAAEGYIGKLNDLRERLTVCEKEDNEKEKRRKLNIDVAGDDVEPPENFRELNVLPTPEDLLHERPYLRANVVTGGYKDTEHYLDVQFRLLREDCFGPLRDGISQYMKEPHKMKYDNIRVYHNVKFVEPYISKNKMGETILLDEKSRKRLKRINWAHSKRFIYGSLLLLTKDNCKSFITATILDRDVKLLNEGKIPISIMDKNSTAINCHSDDSAFIMIESEVYFEPYYHVLQVLQDTEFPEHLAMEKYIVKVDSQPNHPAYLTPELVYSVITTNDENVDEIAGNAEKTKFRVLDEMTWPSRNDLGLNASQYEAYKLALTHEFAVIQGPPGTGKTFLGVKVAKTLLENLSPRPGKCLMLVICYTNHALDQFLEAILSVTSSIVRIGGQSRNEAMEKINLSTLRKSRGFGYDVKGLFFNQKRLLTVAVNELKHAQEKLDSLSDGVLSTHSLENYDPEVKILRNYYAQNRQDVKEDPIIHWLFENMQVNNEDINDLLMAEDMQEQNEENYAINDVDIDNEDMEVLLDEYDLTDLVTDDEEVEFSFSLGELQNKIKKAIMLLKRTQDPMTQRKLYREIIDAKSRGSHFVKMSENRRETRLRLTNGMNLSLVSMAQRWAIYYRWANVIYQRLSNNIRPLQDTFKSASAAYEEVRTLVDIQILKGIKVIGMTTSGAARQRKLLQSLAPRIMIVEEAAEVLEQHIVTSLTKHCEHLILIGDHQQLRPSAAYMRLARHYNLEVSLFERMIKNGVHSRRLGVQHRMRPDIAALITPHIYPDLQNHPSVEQFPNVRGMTDNLFFFTHDYKEELVEDTASKSNQLEADMTLKLAQYLMQQGYEPSDITILAAYSGQMFYMRKQRAQYSFLSKVKITVVDNYQGEESKIILLSLVRNNDQNKIGFLGTENRVCVALSRAREGFYIFGNIDILKKNSELWTKIAKTLEEMGCLGPALMLKCENHTGQITTISCPKDFEKVPEGGCDQTCGYELPCGHQCTLVCHGYDRGHVQTRCFKPCARISLKCELNHVCPSQCWVKCGPCMKLVPKTLPCGHQQLVYCHLEVTDPTIKCQTLEDVTLPHCSHKAEKKCYLKIEAIHCTVPCVTRVDKCGHQCRLMCHVTNDPDHEKYNCLKPCELPKKGCTANLEGDRGNHQCTRLCCDECEPCTVEVKKKRSNCKHVENRVPCNVNIDEIPCRKNCARAIPDCGHFCRKKCFEPCGDCSQEVIKVIPDCNHKIKVQCKITPTRDLCVIKCERKLACGHLCTGRCSEACDSKKCTEIVQHKVMAPCGHFVMLPCNVYQEHKEGLNITNQDVGLFWLLDYCQEPCGQTLSCEHVCAGTCGACRQGRLHVACKETCDRPNFCGHLCKEPCSQVCPPCNRVCEIKCPHSNCNKLCGAPCRPCQEKCSRACMHGACSRRCGQACDRAPCGLACPERLPCGHACRGLCGEPCPDVCNLCRPDDFPKDFLGDPFDDDAKFLKLEDCTHVLEVETMDNLMGNPTSSTTARAIEIRACPYCRTPILNTQRYKDLINRNINTDINKAKKKIYGDAATIQDKRKQLHLKATAFAEQHQLTLTRNRFIKSAMVELQKSMKQSEKGGRASLPKLETQLQYLEILDVIVECYEKYRAVNINLEKFAKLIEIICTTLKLNVDKISQQLQEDIANEIRRMNTVIQLGKILTHSLYLNCKEIPKVKQAAKDATMVVFSWRRFDRDAAVVALKALEETVKVSGIVSEKERELVIKAIGSKPGSWYSCPNGHIYSIGQCGGAMEEAKCADCDAAIGGTHHRLRPDNAHARVDGSAHAAWSNEYNNMANWNLDI